MRKNNYGIFIIAFSLFTTGFTYIVDEYILSQVGSNILGNPAEQWALVIGMMIFSTALGAFMAKFIPDSKSISSFLTFEVLLSLFGGFAPILIMWTYAHWVTSFSFVFYLVAFFIGFLGGFQPVLIGSINNNFIDFKGNLVMILSIDALGVALGTLIYVKLIIGQVPLWQASFIATSANLTSAIIAFFYFRHLSKSNKIDIKVPIWTGIMIGLAFLIAITGLYHSKNIILDIEQQLYTGKIIHKKDSRFQHIVLTENKETGVGMLFLNGGLQFSTKDEVRYHENLVHPAMTFNFLQNPKDSVDVLILGGGDGFVARELHKYSNIASITLVDLDPEVVKLAKTHPKMLEWNDSSLINSKIHFYNPDIPRNNAKEKINIKTIQKDKNGKNKYLNVAEVEIMHADAYRFVEELNMTHKKFDVVIVDFPDPRNEGLGKLYSKYFYIQLKKLLDINGTIAIQSSSPIHVKKAYLCIGNTLESAGLDILPYQDNIPSFNQWGWYLAKHPNQNSWATLTKKIFQMNNFLVETKYLTPQKFFANTFFDKDYFKDKEKLGINALVNPKIVYLYNKMGWKME